MDSTPNWPILTRKYPRPHSIRFNSRWFIFGTLFNFNGDWLLGTAIGLALMSPWLALITLFHSNFLACITMLPQKKGKRNRKIHFGPFMVAAFILTVSFADFLISML